MDSRSFRTVDEYWKWVFSLPILETAGKEASDISTWNEANTIADSDDYVNAIVAASNDMVAKIRAVDEIEFQIGWNARGKSLQPMEDRFLNERVLPQIHLHGEYRFLSRCIVDQVAMGAMEILYLPVVHFDWNRRLVNVLATGHVVCGYRGEYPNGEFIVF